MSGDSMMMGGEDIGTIVHEAEQNIGIQMSQAREQIQKGFNINDKDPKLNKVAAYYYHYTRKYQSAIYHASRVLTYLQEYVKKYVNIKKIYSDALFILADSYYYLGQFDTSEIIFQKIIASSLQSTDLFTIDQVNQKLQQIQTIKQKSYKEEKQELIQELQQEGIEFYRKIEQCEKSEYMKQHGMPVFVIPKKWFSQWKKYVGYNEIQEQLQKNKQNGDTNPKQEESKNREKSNSNQNNSDNENEKYESEFIKSSQRKKSIPKKEKQKLNEFEVIETKYKHLYPGPIDCSDILETYPILQNNLLQDPDKVKQFTNLILKREMQENEDFVLFPAPVGKLLFDKYNGVKVKRLILYIEDDSSLTQVEIYPMKIEFLIIPLFSTFQDQKILKTYINKKETIANFKQKIFRILSAKKMKNFVISPTDCKLWRCSNIDNLKLMVKSYMKRENSSVYIDAKLLDNSSTPLDEAEIADNDIIVVEYKEQGMWVLQNETEKVVINTCGACGKKDDDLYYCECHLIRYCNEKCQKDHRPKHRNICIQTKNQLLQQKEILNQFKIKTDRKQNNNAVNGVCGLQNLGNTCFMNSSLQCLSNVLDLTEYMLQDKFLHDLNTDNPLGTGGYLAANYAELIKDMWRGSNSYVSPWALKKTIGKFASQFNGYSQQDSQELLSFLLDGIHEDLNRVKKKPQVVQIESDGQNDLEVALKSWENYLKRNRSIIVDLMVGQFKSTLICPTCNKISVTFDPYMAISVPVPSVDLISLDVYIKTRDSSSLLLTQYFLRSSDTVKELKEQIANELKISVDKIDVFLQSTKNFLKNEEIDDNISIEKLINTKDLIMAFEKLSELYDQDVPQDYNKQIQLNLAIGFVDEKEEISFTTYKRIFYIGANTTYETIHVKVWQIYRQYLCELINKSPQNKQFKINLEQDSMEYLLQEYKQFVKFSENNNSQYNLTLQKYEIDFDKNKSLSSEFESLKIQKEFCSLDLYLQTTLPKLPTLNQYDQRNKSRKNEYNLYDCLDLFISKEILGKGNEWYCNRCKDHKQATKRMEIFDAPKILIIHIKRFKINRVSSIGKYYYQSGGQKLESLINFPVDGLDMTKYVLSNQYKQNKEPLLYDLFAVSNHYGNMSGGHYTAYGKNPVYNRWFDFNDSSVSDASPDEVVSRAAYVLFYKKREKSIVNN